jgi:CP family cyanate transporter-like MFS transporter
MADDASHASKEVRVPAEGDAPHTVHTIGIHPSSVIVLTGMCAALHVAKIPPALPVLQAELGLTLLQAGFLLSAVQVASMTLGLLVGLSVDGLGLKRSMLFGLGLLFAASALGGFAHHADVLLLLRAVEGLGFLCVVMPAPSLIRRTVLPEQLNGRMGWWGTYMPTGNALALLVGPLFVVSLGWHVWWWLLSGITLATFFWVRAAVPDVQVVTAPSAQTNVDATDGGSIAPSENINAIANDSAWRERLKSTVTSKGPWLVSLSFAVYASQWMAVIGFLPTVYAQMGLSAGLTGVLTACVALVNVSGNIMSGRLLQRGWPARRLLQIGFACMALGAIGAFAQWQSQGLPTVAKFVCVVMFSAVGGLIPGTLFSTAVRLASSENTVSTTVGFMQQLSAVGQFLGPPLVAWVAVIVGGWQWTWVVTVSLSVIGLWLAQRIGHALLAQQMK